jgi:extracellular factor (EF) 3-hydroxypalmitic acid methyl ester biosynthesis protein
MEKEQSITKKEIFNKLDELKDIGEFGKEYHSEIDQIVLAIGEMKRSGEFTQDDITEINNYYGQEFLKDTLQGMSLIKKFGYAGDFLMIDKIYAGISSDHKFHKSWDKYYLNHAAPKAVQNRKEYFKKVIREKLAADKEVKLLNVASGPARDLSELYKGLKPDETLKTTCIDMDKHAVEYAKEVTSEFESDIEYVNRNIFRFKTDEKYDAIWSAGLFDYFDDKGFVMVLKRFKEWCSEDGEIIIGNFNSEHNPTRDYMEIFGEWFLHHRTEKELIDLGVTAGFEKNQMIVDRETENVNLFLHIKMTKA